MSVLALVPYLLALQRLAGRLAAYALGCVLELLAHPRALAAALVLALAAGVYGDIRGHHVTSRRLNAAWAEREAKAADDYEAARQARDAEISTATSKAVDARLGELAAAGLKLDQQVKRYEADRTKERGKGSAAASVCRLDDAAIERVRRARRR